jgi:hypothetical protein
MSLNETGLLSKLSILAALLVRFHRAICTIIMRVRMTQLRLAGAMHCTDNLGVMLDGSVNVGAGRRHPAAMLSAFRHICAR